MAAGHWAGPGRGCAARGLRGWLLTPAPPAARRAHAGAADRLQREYDAVVIGAGHNGLVAAAYLQRAGLRTAVLEKRHVLGGAAVTEEIVPGFKFSRASYLLSLLRPQIYTELELQRHGLRVLPRDPYSFTPLLEDRSPPRSLLLGNNRAQTQQQIAQFSQKDAQAYPEYEAFMEGLVSALDPLLDAAPVDTAALGQGSLLQRLSALRSLWLLLRAGLALGRQLPRYYEVLTAPVSKAVSHVLLGRDGQAQGVVLQDGTEVRSKLVLSNASPQITFLELIPQEQLPKDFVRRIQQVDTCSPVTKINVAVDRLPSFLAAPNARDGQPLPHHQCSIHLNCEGTHLLHQAFTEATHGHPSSRPMIELCIPSVLDPGLAPQGCHVVSLFTQYTPSVLAGGQHWDEQARNAYADTVFDCIEAYAPGFKASVIGRDILTPPDLERIFGLPGGNIFHGGMSLDQLYFARPAPSYSGYRSPIPSLYLCGSGAHPGGGVMGGAGRNAAHVALQDFRHL
ncbi:pyridine nucleotide-disulfide oxidoreductase domain-containing protein 2 isoform X3 [Lathamus discolor]|uniref:pyridine nucleotide-disulfide oxidoreductase domain-containing protein 2 isoform X3 n=1 Tax=Lathamus discolor TaxID=678569 RepID=UPI0032B7779D